MDKHLIDEIIYNVIEKSKIKTPEIWENIIMGEEIPKTFFDIVSKELNKSLKPRHIRYIKSKIEHIINECIQDIKEI